MIILLNKPYGVLSQFSGEDKDSTLAAYVPIKNVYPAGRLDKDSEGLLLLTDDGRLQHQLSDPKYKMPKTYWAQVEGVVTDAVIEQLSAGLLLKDGLTAPARVKLLHEPKVWDREPPIRVRKSIPDAWIEICITEGRNRQVRRMTAAVGLPCLRLIRTQIGEYQLSDLQLGEYKEVTASL